MIQYVRKDFRTAALRMTILKSSSSVVRTIVSAYYSGAIVCYENPKWETEKILTHTIFLPSQVQFVFILIHVSFECDSFFPQQFSCFLTVVGPLTRSLTLRFNWWNSICFFTSVSILRVPKKGCQREGLPILFNQGSFSPVKFYRKTEKAVNGGPLHVVACGDCLQWEKVRMPERVKLNCP